MVNKTTVNNEETDMNISEIAKLAGVSVATVSRTINNRGKVSPEVQKRVMEIVEKYHYVPNATGRSLRTSKTGMILVSIPDVFNSFYFDILQGIEKQTSENGYNIIVAPTQGTRTIEDKYISMLTTKQVDGFIALNTCMNATELYALSRNYPLVMACECPTGANVSCVEIDNHAAAYEAVKYLIHAGHSRIGMISSSLTCTSSIQRENGFKDACLDSHIHCHETDIIHNLHNFEGGYKACQILLNSSEPPTAIFCYSDEMAIGAIRYIFECNLTPGKDIDVIGFDDVDISQMYTPSITSVSQPCYDIGITATDLLMEKIKNIDSTIKKVILPHQLILRQTTKIIATK